MKRALLAIIGSILGLAGLGLLASGGLLLAAFGTDGRAQLPLGTVASTKGRAIVLNNLQINAADSLPLNESWFDLNLAVSGGQSHFVGVATKKDALGYLQGVPYELLTGVDSSSSTLQGTAIPGSNKPDAPDSVTIWEDKEVGQDVTVSWPVSNLNTSLVVMNEDLSADVKADIGVDVRVGWASTAAIGLVVAGIVAVVVGIVLLALALRSKSSPAGPAEAAPQPESQA